MTTLGGSILACSMMSQCPAEPLDTVGISCEMQYKPSAFRLSGRIEEDVQQSDGWP
jgi:hypothetical protein